MRGGAMQAQGPVGRNANWASNWSGVYASRTPITFYGRGGAMNRYAYIDALRGYAILGVIVVHTSDRIANLPSPLLTVAWQGARGVQLFFVVSAITLMMSWHARASSVGDFYVRRIFRIAPMFWLAIPGFFLLHGFEPRFWAPNGIGWPHIAATFAFLHGWHPETITSVVPGGWSIAVEMTFYAIFPLLALAIRSWVTAALGIAATVGLAAILNPWIIGVFTSPDMPARLARDFAFLWFFNQLPVFFVGIFTFFLIRGFAIRPLSASFVATGALLTLLILPFYRPPLLDLHLWFALSFGALAYGLSQGGLPFMTALPVRWLGTISYSAYFWHFAVLDFVPLDWREGTGWFLILLAGVLTLTAALSYATYRFIELPMIRMGSGLAQRLRKQNRAALAA